MKTVGVGWREGEGEVVWTRAEKVLVEAVVKWQLTLGTSWHSPLQTEEEMNAGTGVRPMKQMLYWRLRWQWMER